MPKLQDLTGRRFGDLLVLRRGPDYVSPTGKKTVQWICRCEACGREVTMLRTQLDDFLWHWLRNIRDQGYIQ